MTIADSTGNIRTMLTNAFGYYRFGNVTGGGTYTIGATAKAHAFTPRTMQINDNLTNVDLVAAP